MKKIHLINIKYIKMSSLKKVLITLMNSKKKN